MNYHFENPAVVKFCGQCGTPLRRRCKQCGLGQIEKGLAALAEALDVVDKTGERFYEAELYRLKGELLLQQENRKSKGKKQKSEEGLMS